MTRSSSRSRILRSERSIKSHVNWDRCRMDLVKQGHGMAEARKWNEATRYLHVALTKGCGWCEFKFRLGRFRKRDLSQRVNPTATAWNIWTRSHCWSGDFGPVLSPSPWRQLYPWMMLGALILLWGWCHSPQWFRRPVQCKAICSIAYLIVQLCSFRHIKAEQWIWRLIFFLINQWLAHVQHQLLVTFCSHWFLSSAVLGRGADCRVCWDGRSDEEDLWQRQDQEQKWGEVVIVQHG